MSEILISPARLQEAMVHEPWLVFDVRHDLADHEAGRRAYEHGHIPGAVHLDHERQLSAPRTGRNGRHPLPGLKDFSALMRGLGLRPESRVAVYDASGGMFAAHLWWMLRWMGHEHAAVLDGGWQAWLAAGGRVEKGAEDRFDARADEPAASSRGASSAATHDERPRGGATAEERGGRADDASAARPGEAPTQGMPTVDADAVLANLSDPAFTVLDARAPERYRGEVEPMDPVAGHIPGALNRPNSLNLQADGRFKPTAQLREEFVSLLDGRRPAQVVHQCGSGITASHNLFAMELAGLNGSALYPGSWSEWCSDPNRPIATGD